jgi:predicted nucleotidyltransferase
MQREKVFDIPSFLRRALLSMEGVEEAEAIGIFGSLARGDFCERSDIDVFVIVEEWRKDMERVWWERVQEALKDVRRDVTVIVYSIKALKDIANWYVLRLASEGVILHDVGGVKELFKKIVATAHKAGLRERKIGTHKVWSAKDATWGKKFSVRLNE